MALVPVRRYGFYSMKRTAKELCRLVAAFTPVIQRYFPESTALLLALEAANLACGVLAHEIEQVETPGV